MATSSNLLSPEELAALAQGIDDGTIAIDTGFNLTTRVKKHDLASEDSTLGVNTSSLEMINERINEIARVEGARPIIFSTLVDDAVREVVKGANGFFLDFFELAFIIVPLLGSLWVAAGTVYQPTSYSHFSWITPKLWMQCIAV